MVSEICVQSVFHLWLKILHRPLNPRQCFFFAKNFEQMIQARAVGIAGGGEARRVDEHAGFHAGVNAPVFIRRNPGASGSP